MGKDLRLLYDAIGGMETCRQLSELFHERVAGDPVLKAVFPRNLGPATERLALFMAQTIGGPNDYTRRRGKQNLTCRHAHVPIGSAEIDAWLREMAGAMEDAGIPEPARRLLQDYFLETAGTVGDPLLHLYHVPLDELKCMLVEKPSLATSLLSNASGHWDVPRVQMLLESWSTTAVREPLGHDALYRACNALSPGREEDGLATVALLIQHGADVNGLHRPGNMTPLHMAARRGNEQIAELLLDAGANIEARDTQGETPLRRAVNCRQRGFVRMLLSRGADPQSKDKKGQSPLGVARPGPIREVLLQSVGSVERHAASEEWERAS